MARIVERNTGSVVNVPDEKVDQIVGLGYYDLVEEKKPAKKAASKSAK